MIVHLEAHYVSQFVVFGNTSTEEAKNYNTKSMNVIFNVLPNLVKEKVGQCSMTKII